MPQPLDYSEFIEIAPGIYWVGLADTKTSLHCNPYLITDGDEAVLLDGGNRADFSAVMLKVMRAGTSPKNIRRLIYHHYDPDLCGSLPYLEALIDSPELKIISHYENNIFINYYSNRSPKQCIEQLGLCYRFTSGRELRFIRTPYSHSAGSFMTYDTQSRVLFSSDLFGSNHHPWDLFTGINADCVSCEPATICPRTGKPCELTGILNFHRRVMTSRPALDYALDRVEELNVSLIAPQHGSILDTAAAQKAVIRQLRALRHIGFDAFLEVQNR